LNCNLQTQTKQQQQHVVQQQHHHHHRSHSKSHNNNNNIINNNKLSKQHHHRPTLKPPSSYLIPNPKFHPTDLKQSSASNATIDTLTAAVTDVHQSSTLNPVYEYSEEINAQAEREFAERRQHLWEVCERSQILSKFTPNAWEFFISPGHGLAWCNVFKAASTTWMYYFNILGKQSSSTTSSS